MSVTSVTLEHVGTKERVVLEVESFTEGRVSVRWPMAGVYDIDLLNNTIRPRSRKTISRYGAYAMDVWRVVDIEALRKAVWTHYHPKDGSYDKHVQNMPYRAKMLGSISDGKPRRRA